MISFLIHPSGKHFFFKKREITENVQKIKTEVLRNESCTFYLFWLKVKNVLATYKMRIAAVHRSLRMS